MSSKEKAIVYKGNYNNSQYKIMKQLLQTRSDRNFDFYLRWI